MTLIRVIKGFTSRDGMKRVPLVIHFTSDDYGETLSVASEPHNIQFTMKYSDIEKIVNRERAKGYTNGHGITTEEEPEA